MFVLRVIIKLNINNKQNLFFFYYNLPLLFINHNQSYNACYKIRLYQVIKLIFVDESLAVLKKIDFIVYKYYYKFVYLFHKI